jgi:peptidoglycan glycosyltransferase
VNGPLRRIAAFLGLLLAVILGGATYVQAIDSRHLGHEVTNPRPLLTRFSQTRGEITLADGTIIAKSVAVRSTNGGQDTYTRDYPVKELFAQVTGWAGITSTTGVERAEDDLLSGTDERLTFSNLGDTLLGRQRKPGYVVLSLSRAAQEAATQGLQTSGRKGAVVALDVKTGAVLALVSLPTFDPTPLSSRSSTDVETAYKALSSDKDQPLLDRATAARQPPGSLFKIVTSATALSAGDYTPDTQIASPQSLKLPLSSSVLQNFGGESCGGAKTTLTHALAISCNTAFAQLGLDLGEDKLRAQAQAFGIGSSLDAWPIAQTSSVFPDSLDKPQTALAAIGQYDVALTPLNAAMIIQAIANKGVLLKPQIVAEEHGPDGGTLHRADPEVLNQATTPEVAAQLTTMMEAVTGPGGTAGGIFTSLGVPVAGKTGTAQHAANEPPHAWFGGFAPADDPRYAVVAFVEDGGNAGSEATGAGVAAPIVAKVMAALLGKNG